MITSEMITSDNTSKSINGHYLHHGEPDRHGNYVDKSERVKYESARNIAGDPTDRHQMTKQMEAVAEQNGQVEKPYFHAKLSLDAGRDGQGAERLSGAEWDKVRDAYAEKMGLSGRQCWMVVHHDKPHEHAHLIFGRVSQEDGGSAWNAWKSHHRSQTAAREIEQEHGLRGVQGTLGRHAGGRVQSDVGQTRPPERGSQIPSPAVAEYKRTGEVPFAAEVKRQRAGIRQELRGSRSWRELDHRLKQRGMKIEPSGGGAVLARRGGGPSEKQPLSKIDRASSLPKLENRLGSYGRYVGHAIGYGKRIAEGIARGGRGRGR